MKMGKLNILTSVLLSSLLSACGGDSDATTTDPIVNEAPVSAQDGFDTVTPNESSYVDLSNLIDSGTAGAKVIFISLESKQGEGKCPRILTSSEADSPNGENFISGMGFNLTVEGAAMCEYSYEVESVALAEQATTSATAKVIVASSADNDALLPTILVAMVIGESEETNIKLALGINFPEGYTLSEDFSVLGDGSVTMVATDFTITYEATAEGLSRVVYSLEGEIGDVPDIKMGTIDYAVSDNFNDAPTADNFPYNGKVGTNSSVNIDVVDHSKSNDDYDLQLVKVDSYTASVESIDANDLENTTFTFEAFTDGKHYVSYMVSDHRGGFATGIVEVEVIESQDATWFDIEHGFLLFSAPETHYEVEQSGDEFQGFFEDNTYVPPLDIATFSLAGAQAYCSPRGRLPTTGELNLMKEARDPIGEKSWPDGRAYITEDGTLLSLGDGVTTGDYFYVTCVDSGGLSLYVTNAVAVANGIDLATITVEFMRESGSSTAGAIMAVSATNDVMFESNTVTINDEGKGYIEMTSNTAVESMVTVEHTIDGEVISVNDWVSFIGDINTAVVTELTVLVNDASPDGVDVNTLNAKVLDVNDNPVPDVSLNIIFDSNTAKVVDEYTLTTSAEGGITFNVINTIVESVLVTASHVNTSGTTTYQEATIQFQLSEYDLLLKCSASGFTEGSVTSMMCSVVGNSQRYYTINLTPGQFYETGVVDPPSEAIITDIKGFYECPGELNFSVSLHECV